MVKLQNDGKHIITNLSGFFYARYTEFTWQSSVVHPNLSHKR